MLWGSAQGPAGSDRRHRASRSHRLAALALTAAVSAGAPAAALALGTRVSEKVSQRTIRVGAKFSLTATGEASRHAVLWQFLDYDRCAPNEKAEAKRHVVSDHEPVFGVFKVGPLSADSEKAGADHACAYLVHRGATLARSAAAFSVVR